MRFLLQNDADTMHGYAQNDIHILTYISQIIGILGVLSSLFIIINYVCISSLCNQLSYQMILCVAISDLITSVAEIIGSPSEDSVWCTTQAIMVQFGVMSSVLWVVSISWMINRLSNGKDLPTRKDLKRILCRMHCVIWSVSSVVTILPSLTASYCPAVGGWCWIKNGHDNIVWRLYFYGMIWIAVGYMVYVYIKTWRHIHIGLSVQEQSAPNSENVPMNEESNADSSALQDAEIESIRVNVERERAKKRSKALKRMKLFPLILILGYSIGTIRRIIEMFGVKVPFWLVALQVVNAGLRPIADAMVYGFNDDVRKRVCGLCVDGASQEDVARRRS